MTVEGKHISLCDVFEIYITHITHHTHCSNHYTLQTHGLYVIFPNTNCSSRKGINSRCCSFDLFFYAIFAQSVAAI